MSVLIHASTEKVFLGPVERVLRYFLVRTHLFSTSRLFGEPLVPSQRGIVASQFDTESPFPKQMSFHMTEKYTVSGGNLHRIALGIEHPGNCKDR
jgi:hypothetical protein